MKGSSTWMECPMHWPINKAPTVTGRQQTILSTQHSCTSRTPGTAHPSPAHVFWGSCWRKVVWPGTASLCVWPGAPPSPQPHRAGRPGELQGQPIPALTQRQIHGAETDVGSETSGAALQVWGPRSPSTWRSLCWCFHELRPNCVPRRDRANCSTTRASVPSTTPA